jgi:Spy/CpxP family protein refolding chaperone
MIMKRLTVYLGLALAACLSCFSLSAAAADSIGAYHLVRASFAMHEPQGVAFKRLELTLAQWRTGQADQLTATRSDMRASSNGFVFDALPSTKAVAEPSLT